MREIKFREYNKHWKKMYEPFTLVQAITAGGILDRYNKDSVFMQYTGLEDKNGKEIYEGDIVKIPNDGISEVKWNYGEWNVEDFSHNAGSNNIYNFLTSQIEIIGNIYENPELLT